MPSPRQQQRWSMVGVYMINMHLGGNFSSTLSTSSWSSATSTSTENRVQCSSASKEHIDRGQVQRSALTAHRQRSSTTSASTVHRERSSTTSASTQYIDRGQKQQEHRHSTSTEVKHNKCIDTVHRETIKYNKCIDTVHCKRSSTTMTSTEAKFIEFIETI